jgi:predicted Zn-dependent protease
MIINARPARIVFFLTLCLSCISCASMEIKNIEDSATFEKASDEDGLWAETERIQKCILNTNYISANENLNTYVNGILEKVTGGIAKEKGITTLKAYVVNDPNFNASAWPNGVIFVHTGLLANLDNEAQLATILGHETVHFLHRHVLKQHRNVVNMSAFMCVVQVATVGASAGMAYSGYDPSGLDLFRQYMELGVVGAIYGYSRDLEREADAGGFEMIKKAGYDPRESKKAFENLLEATKDEKVTIPYFYQSHPKIRERIKEYDVLLKNLSKEKKEGVEGIVNEAAYLVLSKEILAENILLDIKRSKPKVAEREIAKFMKNYPSDPRGPYFEGKLLLSKKKPDEAGALALFTKSMAMDANFAEVQKEVGIFYYRKGEKEKARPYFRKYLEINPGAKDIEYIRGYLNG